MDFEITTIFGNLKVSIYQECDNYTYIDGYITTTLGNSYTIELTKNYDLDDIEIDEEYMMECVSEILDVFVDKLSEGDIDYKIFTTIS